MNRKEYLEECKGRNNSMFQETKGKAKKKRKKKPVRQETVAEFIARGGYVYPAKQGESGYSF